MSISEISAVSALPLRSSARISAIAARARGPGAVRSAATPSPGSPPPTGTPPPRGTPAAGGARRRDGPGGGPEQPPLLVEPVQSAGVHERERPALLDGD